MNLLEVIEILPPQVYVRRGELVIHFADASDLVARVLENFKYAFRAFQPRTTARRRNTRSQATRQWRSIRTIPGGTA